MSFVRLFRIVPLTLRGRFFLWAIPTLLALSGILAAGVFVAFLPVYESLESVVKEVIEERVPTDRIHTRMDQAARALDRYLILRDPNERDGFLRLAGEANQAFADASASPFGREDEREALAAAETEWRKAASLGESLLAASGSSDGPDLKRTLDLFHAHLDRATAALVRVSESSFLEVNEMAAASRERKRGGFLLFGALFLFGIVLAAAGGIALTRYVLAPVNRLAEGAKRVARGEFSYRVSWPHADEFGRLARAFNAMAEKVRTDRDRLAELSMRDPLTGLYNRRAFRERLGEELARSRRYAHPCSLLILDIDGLKAINDAHGHQAGDTALFVLANGIRAAVRKPDIVARYGGDEFILLLPETPGAVALDMAERIRAAAAREPVTVADGRSVEVTVSAGMASFPEDADSEESLVAAADKALYAAKNAGRNRAVRAERALGGRP